MGDEIANTGSADAELRSFVDRILKLHEEADEIAADRREVYAEAKSRGFDKTALGALVSELRKRAKDSAAVDEAESILELYREAYHRASSHTHTPARAA